MTPYLLNKEILAKILIIYVSFCVAVNMYAPTFLGLDTCGAEN